MFTINIFMNNKVKCGEVEQLSYDCFNWPKFSIENEL